MRFDRPIRWQDTRTLAYDGQVLLTREHAETWVRLPPVPYSFRHRQERLDLGWATILSLAALRQGFVRFKVIQRPADRTWVQAVDSDVRATSRPAAGWDQYLIGQQRAARRRSATEKVAYLGVGLGDRGFARLARTPPEPAPPVSKREWARWHTAAAAKLALLRKGAYLPEPIPVEELRRLRLHALYRDVVWPRPSATGRKSWGAGQIVDEFADVELVPVVKVTPRGPVSCVRVDTAYGSTYSATWVLAAFPDVMDFPDSAPWLSWPDRLGFLTEMDVLADLQPMRSFQRRIRHRLNLAREQSHEAGKAGMDLPLEIADMIALARTLEYELPASRLPPAFGWARMRVNGDSPSDLAEKYEEASQHYGAIGGTGIDLRWPGGMSQVDLLLEGIPGQRVRHRSWRQVWLTETLACALPHAASGLTQPRGSYLGYTTGRIRQAVRWDPHHPIRVAA